MSLPTSFKKCIDFQVMIPGEKPFCFCKSSSQALVFSWELILAFSPTSDRMEVSSTPWENCRALVWGLVGQPLSLWCGELRGGPHAILCDDSMWGRQPWHGRWKKTLLTQIFYSDKLEGSTPQKQKVCEKTQLLSPINLGWVTTTLQVPTFPHVKQGWKDTLSLHSQGWRGPRVKENWFIKAVGLGASSGILWALNSLSPNDGA